MFPQNAATWALYIVLTILFGALGTACWEAVLKPIFVHVGRLLLKVATLGTSSLRDAIYRDMAARPTYKPALFLVLLIVIGFSGVLGYTASGYYYSHFQRPPYVTKAQHQAKLKDMSPEELDQERRNSEVEIHELEKELSSAWFSLALFAFILTALPHARYRYMSAAIAHFDQLMAICAPYLSNEDEKAFRSAFAQIACRNDYLTIVEKLRDHAHTHGVSKLPGFYVF